MDNLVLQLKQLITNQDIITSTTTHLHRQQQQQQLTPHIALQPVFEYIPQPLINFWYRKTPQQRNTLLLKNPYHNLPCILYSFAFITRIQQQ